MNSPEPVRRHSRAASARLFDHDHTAPITPVRRARFNTPTRSVVTPVELHRLLTTVARPTAFTASASGGHRNYYRQYGRFYRTRRDHSKCLFRCRTLSTTAIRLCSLRLGALRRSFPKSPEGFTASATRYHPEFDDRNSRGAPLGNQYKSSYRRERNQTCVNLRPAS